MKRLLILIILSAFAMISCNNPTANPPELMPLQGDNSSFEGKVKDLQLVIDKYVLKEEIRAQLLTNLNQVLVLIGKEDFDGAVTLIDGDFMWLYRAEEKILESFEVNLRVQYGQLLTYGSTFLKDLNRRFEINNIPRIIQFSTRLGSCTVEHDPSRPLIDFEVVMPAGSAGIAKVEIISERYDSSRYTIYSRLSPSGNPWFQWQELGLADSSSPSLPANSNYTLEVTSASGYKARETVGFATLDPVREFTTGEQVYVTVLDRFSDGAPFHYRLYGLVNTASNVEAIDLDPDLSDRSGGWYQSHFPVGTYFTLDIGNLDYDFFGWSEGHLFGIGAYAPDFCTPTLTRTATLRFGTPPGIPEPSPAATPAPTPTPTPTPSYSGDLWPEVEWGGGDIVNVRIRNSGPNPAPATTLLVRNNRNGSTEYVAIPMLLAGQTFLANNIPTHTTPGSTYNEIRVTADYLNVGNELYRRNNTINCRFEPYDGISGGVHCY